MFRLGLFQRCPRHARVMNSPGYASHREIRVARRRVVAIRRGCTDGTGPWPALKAYHRCHMCDKSGVYKFNRYLCTITMTVAHRQGGFGTKPASWILVWLRAHGSFPGFVLETPRRGRLQRKARSPSFRWFKWLSAGLGSCLPQLFWRKQSMISGYVHLINGKSGV
jgi:hypothetical protein